MADGLERAAPASPVFFADGSLAGRLGEVAQDGFVLQRDDGTRTRLGRHSFNRFEDNGVYLGCDSSSLPLFVVPEGK